MLTTKLLPSLSNPASPLVRTWERITPTPANVGTLYGICKNDTTWVIVGNTTAGSIFTSSDCVNWTQRTMPSSNTLANVIWANNLFVAVGHSGLIVTSPDGITWTQRTSGTTTANLYDIAWTGSQFIITGSHGYIRTSTTGLAWIPKASGTTSYGFKGIAYSDSIHVAVSNGRASTSPDGSTWTFRTVACLEEDVVWTGSQFVSMNLYRSISTSPDGITWTQTALNNTALRNLKACCYEGGVVTAVGYGGVIAATDNYSTWVESDSTVTTALYRVCNIEGTLYAVGAGSVILRRLS